MTLIELLLVPLGISSIAFLLALPFMSVSRAWGVAVLASFALSTAFFSAIWLRLRLFYGSPPCACGARRMIVPAVSPEGRQMECGACGRAYSCSKYMKDGWIHCIAVERARQFKPWMKRRRFSGWHVDTEVVPEIREAAERFLSVR
jgi:hypothetical protein